MKTAIKWSRRSIASRTAIDAEESHAPTVQPPTMEAPPPTQLALVTTDHLDLLFQHVQTLMATITPWAIVDTSIESREEFHYTASIPIRSCGSSRHRLDPDWPSPNWRNFITSLQHWPDSRLGGWQIQSYLRTMPSAHTPWHENTYSRSLAYDCAVATYEGLQGMLYSFIMIQVDNL